MSYKQDYISKVIMSCKTPEQVDTASEWIWRVSLGRVDPISEYGIRMYYEILIRQQLEYLKKLGIEKLD